MFEFAHQFDALVAKPRQRGAVLAHLRLEFVGQAAKMPEFLFDRAQARPPRLDLGGRFEHRGRRFLGARFALAHLGANRGQVLAPRRFAMGEFFKPRVGFGEKPGDFRQAHAGLLVLAARGGYFALDAFHSVSSLAHPALGARKIVAPPH